MTSYTIRLSEGEMLTYGRIPLNGSYHNNKFSAPPDSFSGVTLDDLYQRENSKAELKSRLVRAYNQNGNQNGR